MGDPRCQHCWEVTFPPRRHRCLLCGAVAQHVEKNRWPGRDGGWFIACQCGNLCVGVYEYLAERSFDRHAQFDGDDGAIRDTGASK